MNEHAYWTAVAELRRRIADELDDLSPDEWQARSLCELWTVRDVAGHLSSVPTVTTWQLLRSAPRERFDMNRINTRIAHEHAAAEPGQITARIRRHAQVRGTARVLDTRNALFDSIVHSQDIAVPLGRTFSIEPELAAAGLDRVWQMGMPFHARRRLRGVTLQADDAPVTLGSGPVVRGPALALLLLATGRRDAALPALAGPGIATVSR